MALVGTLAVKAPVGITTVVGIAAGLALLALALRYEHGRLTPQVLFSPGQADSRPD